MSKNEYLQELKKNLLKGGIDKTYEYTFEYENKYNELKRKNKTDEEIYLKLGFPRQVAQEIIMENKEQIEQIQESEVLENETPKKSKGDNLFLKTIVNIINTVLSIFTFILRIILAVYGVLGLIAVIFVYATLSFSVSINFLIYSLITYLLALLLIHSLIRVLISLRRTLRKVVSSKYIETGWAVSGTYFIVVFILFLIAWSFYTTFFTESIQIAMQQGSDRLASIPILGPFLENQNLIK